MQAEENFKPRPQRKTGIRILKWVLVVAVVLIMLVIFLVPAFVSSEKGRKAILARINDSIDGQTNFATLSMSWRKGVKATDISFHDSTGQTSVEVRQIATKPHYCSILMGSLSLGETIIEQPRVKINLTKEMPQKAEAPVQVVSVEDKPKPIVLPIKKIDLIINNGNLKVTNSEAATVELSQINSKLNLRPPGQQTNFEIDMVVADKAKGSRIRADGRIKPKATKTGWSLKGTSGNLTVEVNDLKLGSLTPIFALAGIDIQAKGNVSANIEGEIKDGRIENLTGTIKGRDLDVTGPALKADHLKTSVLDIGVKLRRKKDLINIEQLKVHSDWANVEASGTVPTTFKSLAQFLKPDSIYDLKANFECDLAKALSQMPHIFGLKEGTKVTSGQLSGNIETFTKAGRRKILARTTLAGLAGAVGAKTIALSEPVNAEAQITSDKAGIKFDKLDVSAPFAEINCTGRAELLKYNADIDLAKLQAQLGQFIDIGPYQMTGRVVSQGEVSSKKDKITTVGSSVVSNLRLTSAEGISAFEPKADIAFSVIAERDKNILNVDFIKANASFGQVSIEDAVLPLNEKATKPMKLAVSGKNVDLQKLQPFAVLLASFPKEMQLSGMAESQILVSSKKDLYRIATDATHIKNLKVSYPQQEPFEQEHVSLIFDAEVNPTEKTIIVRKFELVSPQIKIKGELNQTTKGGKTRLNGKADCEYDWSALSTVAGPFLPKGLKLQGKRSDVINFLSEYPTGQQDKLLANLTTRGKLGFEQAEYMGLNFGPTELDIQVQNGRLSIAPFSTTVNNGQLNFAGEADFRHKPTLLKTPGPIQIAKDIQINDQTTRKLLMYLNPVFANAFNVSGVANFSCEQLAIPLAGATQNDIEMVGTISIDQLRLQASDLLSQILSLTGTGMSGQDITIHPTRFVLQNGSLSYDNMQMDIGDNPVNFRGVIGLDKSLNMKVTLPYTTAGRTARVGEKTEGTRITLPLTGTTDKPELDMGKLLEEQLKEQLRQKLQEGLEGLFK